MSSKQWILLCYYLLEGTSNNGAFGFVAAGGAASGAVAMLVCRLSGGRCVALRPYCNALDAIGA